MNVMALVFFLDQLIFVRTIFGSVPAIRTKQVLLVMIVIIKKDLKKYQMIG